MSLTDIACRKARAGSKPQKLADGGGAVSVSRHQRWKVLALGLPVRGEKKSAGFGGLS